MLCAWRDMVRVLFRLWGAVHVCKIIADESGSVATFELFSVGVDAFLFTGHVFDSRNEDHDVCSRVGYSGFSCSATGVSLLRRPKRFVSLESHVCGTLLVAACVVGRI